MNKYILIALATCFFAITMNAQKDRDVLVVGGWKSHNDYLLRPSLHFDYRTSLNNNGTLQQIGVKFGMYINRVNHVGFGYYVGVRSANDAPGLPDDSYESKLSLISRSLFYERILAFNDVVEWSSTIQAGLGEFKTTYYIDGVEEELSLDPVVEIPMELSTSGYLKLYNWGLSLGTGFGYRFLLDSSSEYKQYYNSPLFIVKVRVRVFEFLKEYREYNK